MKIVGLVGPKRVGKSTAADVLVRERGFVSIGFADALKGMALKLNPIVSASEYYDEEHQDGTLRLSDYVSMPGGWEFAKEMPEVRRLLQELGCGVRDIVGLDSWLDCWHVKMMDAYYAGASGVVVPDVRFKNEADYLRNLNGNGWDALLVRVIRPGLDKADTHVSETEQNSIACPVNIVNDGERDTFQVDVLNAVSAWMAEAA